MEKVQEDTKEDPDFDIVEEFIGPELREFEKEYQEIQEHYRKARVNKIKAVYVVKTWKDKIEGKKETKKP